MKEAILKLRSEGLSYKQICEKLNCSKSLVSYHCGEGQKEKTRKREQNRRRECVIVQRVDRFQYDRKIKDKTEDFQRIRISNKGRTKLGKRTLRFSWKDVIAKFGWKTKCYLTGRLIDLNEPKTYQFDHIIPYSKGGEWTLDNLGIVCKEANLVKSDMSVEQLLNFCKEILEYNGFKVMKE